MHTSRAESLIKLSNIINFDLCVGIGAPAALTAVQQQQQQQASANVAWDQKCSAYVAGLPRDFTEKELGEYLTIMRSFSMLLVVVKIQSYSRNIIIQYILSAVCPKDILFSKIGTIRKLRLYRDASGNKKGDGLITYTKPESVAVACAQVTRSYSPHHY